MKVRFEFQVTCAYLVTGYLFILQGEILGGMAFVLFALGVPFLEYMGK